MNKKIALEDFYKIAAISMMCLYAIKMLTVFYYSSRGVDLGWPFDSLVFQQFHRFTDWLIPVDVAFFKNPYSLDEFKEKGLPPTPYTVLAWWILSFTKVIGSKGLYFCLLTILIYSNYFIFKYVNSNLKKIDIIILFLSITITSYPLYFLIDRGNVDIIALIFISFFSISMMVLKNETIAILSLALLVSIKPSWSLYIFPLLIFSSKRNLIISILFVLFIYAYPIIFWGLEFDYMLKVIHAGLPEINNMNYLCSNLSCGIRVFFNIHSKFDWLIANSGIIVLIAAFIYIKFICKYLIEYKLILMFIFTTLITMLINNPNSDFRLYMFFSLIPLIFYYVNKSSINNIFVDVKYLVGFILVFSFINIPIKNLVPYYTTFRLIGLVLLLTLALIQIRRAAILKV